jgi:Tfp pilus assembly protein PilZ
LSDKRDSRRIPFRFIVKYGLTQPPEHTAFLTDLSDSGICIKTRTVFKPGTTLYMSIENAGTCHECEGVVEWAKKVPPSLARVRKSGMGIRFTQACPELIAYYKEKTAVK